MGELLVKLVKILLMMLIIFGVYLVWSMMSINLWPAGGT